MGIETGFVFSILCLGRLFVVHISFSLSLSRPFPFSSANRMNIRAARSCEVETRNWINIVGKETRARMHLQSSFDVDAPHMYSSTEKPQPRSEVHSSENIDQAFVCSGVYHQMHLSCTPASLTVFTKCLNFDGRSPSPLAVSTEVCAQTAFC